MAISNDAAAAAPAFANLDAVVRSVVNEMHQRDALVGRALPPAPQPAVVAAPAQAGPRRGRRASEKMQRSPTLETLPDRLEGAYKRYDGFPPVEDIRSTTSLCLHELHLDGTAPDIGRSSFVSIELLCQFIVAGALLPVPLDAVLNLGGARGAGYEFPWQSAVTMVPHIHTKRRSLFQSLEFLRSRPVFNPDNPRARKVPRDQEADLPRLDHPPSVIRIIFENFRFVISPSDPFEHGSRKLCEFPRLEDLMEASGQLVGLQYPVRTKAGCHGQSGAKARKIGCTQCSDVAISRIVRDSEDPTIWRCDFMVIISPFHSDKCVRLLGTDLRRVHVVHDLAASMAADGYKQERIIAKTAPPVSAETNARSAELFTTLAAAVSSVAIRRCVRTVEKKESPVEARIRTGDTLSAMARARIHENSGYLAGIVPGQAPQVVNPSRNRWISNIVHTMQQSLPEDERDDLIFFVYQSHLQRELRDICCEIAIDSVHAFAKTVASGPDQLLRGLEAFAGVVSWVPERIRFIRSKLRAGKVLLRTLNLITVLGYVDLGSPHQHKVGFPLGYAIVSTEQTPVVLGALRILFPRQHPCPDPELSPPVGSEFASKMDPSQYVRVMTDMALNLRNAVVDAGFPERALRQCTWHVSRALLRHSEKGPKLTVQLNMSIFKFFVFGPYVGASRSRRQEEGDEEADLMEQLGTLGVPIETMNHYRDRLKSLFDMGRANIEKTVNSGRSSSRKVQTLFASNRLSMSDQDSFDAYVRDYLRSIPESDILGALPEPSEPRVDIIQDPRPTTFDGTLLLQALAFFPNAHGDALVRRFGIDGRGRRTQGFAAVDMALPMLCLSQFHCKQTLLETIVSNGFVLSDLRRPTSSGPLSWHASAANQREWATKVLESLRVDDEEYRPIPIEQELMFLSDWLLGVPVRALEDAEDITVESETLLDPPPFNEDGHCLTAISLLESFRQHRGPIRFVLVSSSGARWEVLLRPSRDENSVFYLEDDPEDPIKTDTYRMVVVLDQTAHRIQTLTPLIPDSPVRDRFRQRKRAAGMDEERWHSQVAHGFEWLMNRVSPHLRLDNTIGANPIREEDWELFRILGQQWLNGEDYVGPLPELRVDRQFTLQGANVIDLDLGLLDIPDVAFVGADSDAPDVPGRRKRQRDEEDDQSLPTALLHLPLKPMKNVSKFLSDLERVHSEGLVRLALRRTLALYHWWATIKAPEIQRGIRIADGPSAFQWHYRLTDYRAIWSIVGWRDQAGGVERILASEMPERTSLCHIWLHSLRVSDVTSAARIAWAMSRVSPDYRWDMATPLVRLAWQYAVVEMWKHQIAGTAVGMDAMRDLASFTQQMCCCLAWQQIFAPDCRNHLMGLLEHGCEGEWSAAFYTTPVRHVNLHAGKEDAKRLFGPTTNNALESMHKDIHTKMDRVTGSLSFAVERLPDVMMDIYKSRASTFKQRWTDSDFFTAGEAGMSQWITYHLEHGIVRDPDLVSRMERSEIGGPRFGNGQTRLELGESESDQDFEQGHAGNGFEDADDDVPPTNRASFRDRALVERVVQWAQSVIVEQRTASLSDEAFGQLVRWSDTARTGVSGGHIRPRQPRE